MFCTYGAFIMIACNILCLASQNPSRNSIVKENNQPGSYHSWLQRIRYAPIASGFATKFIFVPGDTVTLKISTLPHVISFAMRIYRLGYYNGVGSRLLETLEVDAIKQPECYFELASRMTDCSNWEISATWKIPTDSVSGIYIALPVSHSSKNQSMFGTYIPFVVRQPRSLAGSDLLFKTSDLSWVAYNKFGGWNLYDGNGSSNPLSRATKASYNRPWVNRSLPPVGHWANFVFGTEYAMLYWLEKQGYDVSYCSCQDIEDMHRDSVLVPADSRKAPPYKVLLSVGHDEYWTPVLKRAFEHAREGGVHLAFFSGNEVYWRVLWDKHTHSGITASLRELGDKKETRNISSAPRMLDHATQRLIPLEHKRIIVCRKDTQDNIAPKEAADWTGTFRDPRHRPAEDESYLTGQWFMVNGHRTDSIQVTRADAALRFWRNTSFYHDHGGVGVTTASRFENSVRPSCAQDRLRQARSEGQLGDAGDVVYVSEAGVLGYEWDEFPVQSRPPGLIPLSTTTIDVQERLVQNFGMSYSGSGNTTHRLSMYRHYNHRSHSRKLSAHSPRDVCEAVRTKPSNVNGSNATGTAVQRSPRARETSLVFGAGTIQWSWALCNRHDGGPLLVEDRDLQQATLNLFADMGVFPGTLCSPVVPAASANASCVHDTAPLAFPVGSTDTTPPTSVIKSADLKPSYSATKGLLSALLPFQQSSQLVLTVSGTAEDTGGAVAAVEVSLNGGRSWHLATGRNHWQFVHHINVQRLRADKQYAHPKPSPGAAYSALNTYRENLYRNNVLYDEGGLGKSASILVLVRAIDDSGWIEPVDVLSVVCEASLLSKSGSRRKKRSKREIARNSVLFVL